MSVPNSLQALELELTQVPNLYQVMTGRNTYALDEEEQLIGLNVRGNGLTDDQLAIIWQHPAWLALNLSENNLSELTISAECTSLRFLNVSRNKDLQKIIFAGALPRLEKLDASECSLQQLPLPTDSSSLRTVEAQRNQLKHIAISGNCPALRLLDLSDNQLTSIQLPASLPQLELLYLQNNQISELKFTGDAAALQTLNLATNELDDISPLRMLLDRELPFRWAKDGHGVLLEDCPLSTPPPEIIEQGNAAIKNYFQQQDKQGKATLYEAKLLIVGKGQAGKTSLCRRLFFPDEDLPEPGDTTKGIDIHHHEFTMSNGKPFRINVWDFGGQQVYHATHQFFLTKRSLYLLLDNTRESQATTVHDEDFKYWLEVVDLLSDHSPLFIFQNEVAGRGKQIAMKEIQGVFENVKGLYKGDLLQEPERSVAKLREAIFFQIRQLPHIEESLPKKWIDIRRHIEDLADDEPYITKEQYLDIYRKYLQDDYDYDGAMLLSRYLHDLGVFLHFQDDDLLERTVILENTWATEAVFKILDDEQVERKFGRFGEKDCRRIWADSTYAGKHPELRALMEKFELCYLLHDTRPKTWLAPQMLPPSRPEELENWEQVGDLILRYEYEFMPKGLINRLMVRLHRYVRRPQLSWQSGVLFEKDGTEVLVQLAARGREIVLRSRGPIRKGLLSTIANELDVLNETFPGLPDKITKWIPCNCEPCLQSASPGSFAQQELLHFKNNDQLQIQCRKSFQQVPVLGLLDGIFVKGHSLGALKDREAVAGIDLEVAGLRQSIETLIRKKNALAEELVLAYDVEKQFSLQEKVSRLQSEIADKRAELQSLATMTTDQPAAGSGRGQQQHQEDLATLLFRTEEVQEQLGALQQQIDAGFSDIVSRLQEQDQTLLKVLELSRDAREELAKLFIQVDAKRFSDEDLEKVNQHITTLIEENQVALPPAVVQQWERLSARSDNTPEAKGKFKLKVPIIPTILSYEKEISWNLRTLTRSIWGELKAGNILWYEE